MAQDLSYRKNIIATSYDSSIHIWDLHSKRKESVFKATPSELLVSISDR